MKKSTQELLKLIESSQNINSYLKAEADSLSVPALHELLALFLEEKHLKKSQCIIDAGIHREYGYQIFSGARIPSRDKILALCLAMRLSREESDMLLRAGGYNSLYSRNKRDSVIIFSLLKHYSTIEANLLLDQIGEAPL